MIVGWEPVGILEPELFEAFVVFETVDVLETLDDFEPLDTLPDLGVVDVSVAVGNSLPALPFEGVEV